MRKQHLCLIGLVFFCSWGWICADPAMGAKGKDSEHIDDGMDIVDQTEEANETGDPDESDQNTEPASLFDDDTIEGVDATDELSNTNAATSATASGFHW